jgi:hypothetical protein
MKVLITMPLKLQASLLGFCDVRSRQFGLLKNGLIEGAGHDRRVVKLLCESAEADAFVDWAATVISAARAEITIKGPPYH